MKNLVSYGLIFLGLSSLVFLSLGGGMWGADQSIGHWTGALFEMVCHQDPMRSFHFNNTPMAVNSRCFGIFTGLWAGWLMIPFVAFYVKKKHWINWILLFAVMLQIIDYMGNHLIWENTNISRAVLGLFLGIAVAVFLSDLFKQN